jgi:hypothetical protein
MYYVGENILLTLYLRNVSNFYGIFGSAKKCEAKLLKTYTTSLQCENLGTMGLTISDWNFLYLFVSTRLSC